MKCLLIIGAGGHGKVVAEAALASEKWESIAFLDARFPEVKSVIGWPVVGRDNDAVNFLDDFKHVFVAIGDNKRRLSVLDAISEKAASIPTIVHPAAWVSPSASLGSGTIVVGGAIVNASVSSERGCIINTGATVDHDCWLGEGVHVSPGAHIGGGCTVGARTWIGIGSTMRHGVSIGEDVIVGAGAAVVGDVPSGVQVRGVPARIVSGGA